MGIVLQVEPPPLLRSENVHRDHQRLSVACLLLPLAGGVHQHLPGGAVAEVRRQEAQRGEKGAKQTQLYPEFRPLPPIPRQILEPKQGLLDHLHLSLMLRMAWLHSRLARTRWKSVRLLLQLPEPTRKLLLPLLEPALLRSAGAGQRRRSRMELKRCPHGAGAVGKMHTMTSVLIDQGTLYHTPNTHIIRRYLLRPSPA